VSPDIELPSDSQLDEEALCSQLCSEQQARIFLRYEAFTAIYITNDINGLLQQKIKN